MSNTNQQPEFVIDDPMKAIEILIRGCIMAQKSGVFSLKDAKIVYDAINFLQPDIVNPPQNNEDQGDKNAESVSTNI